MKTNIIKVTDTVAQRSAILDEAESAAKYNNLSSKATLQLRLLAEELTCMIPELLTYNDGKFWVENEGNDYTINLELIASSYVGLDVENILAVSTSGKNSAKGFVSKIKNMLAIYFSDSAADVDVMNQVLPSFYADESSVFINAAPLSWSLDEYRSNVSSQENYKEKEAWDELEKSIIASLADDVKVSIVGKEVKLTIEKKFA